MIEVKNDTLKLEGNIMELLFDFTTIINQLKKILEVNSDKAVAKEVLTDAFETGMMSYEELIAKFDKSSEEFMNRVKEKADKGEDISQVINDLERFAKELRESDEK